MVSPSTTLTLRTFLKRINDASLVRKVLSDTSPASLESVLFVLGNESADLDSCASSVFNAYAYSVALERGYTINPSFKKPEFVLPLLNIPRCDLNLRPDIKYLFNQIGVLPQSVAFLDDIPGYSSTSPLSPLPKLNASVFLVDHNNLNGATKSIFRAEKVVSVLDHHADENQYLSATPRIVKSCGSCISIAINYWHNLFDSNKKSSEEEGLFSPNDTDLITLAYGPILADTSNMTSKVEEEDVKAFAYLNSIKNAANSAISLTSIEGSATQITSTDQLFQTLNQKKRDISEISNYDILRKDYKEWTKYDSDAVANQSDNIKIGISSIPASLESILTEKETLKQFETTLEKWCQERSLSLAVVMTTYTNQAGKFCRDLVLYQPLESSSEPFDLDKLIRDITDPLQLTEKHEYEEEGEDFRIKVFDQGNTKCSRKQVAPLLRHFLHGIPLTGLKI